MLGGGYKRVRGVHTAYQTVLLGLETLDPGLETCAVVAQSVPSMSVLR